MSLFMSTKRPFGYDPMEEATKLKTNAKMRERRLFLKIERRISSVEIAFFNQEGLV